MPSSSRQPGVLQRARDESEELRDAIETALVDHISGQVSGAAMAMERTVEANAELRRSLSTTVRQIVSRAVVLVERELNLGPGGLRLRCGERRNDRSLGEHSSSERDVLPSRTRDAPVHRCVDSVLMRAIDGTTPSCATRGPSSCPREIARHIPNGSPASICASRPFRARIPQLVVPLQSRGRRSRHFRRMGGHARARRTGQTDHFRGRVLSDRLPTIAEAVLRDRACMIAEVCIVFLIRVE